ncbi:hypothetical protein [Brevibacterium marinum]|uniref:Uncharacterized protein n=1 Tax=Brevibacterium marinum TaxID=418643 RepID=A0A846RSU0_9MICO|nr:hypothetical protein [Brevibacterium marinum]NJC57134.1 hypothetical protein [Brevibacterium marinum]
MTLRPHPEEAPTAAAPERRRRRPRSADGGGPGVPTVAAPEVPTVAIT